MYSIGLIYLPHPYLLQPEAQAPIGLLYLAGSLKQYGYPVSVYNLSKFKSDLEAIETLKEHFLFGITATSLELPIANKFAALLKERFPSCKIVIGGPGTVSPEFIDRCFIDSVCRGEADTEIINIFNDAMNGILKSDYQCSPPENLDTLPFPARELLDSQGGNIFAWNKNYSGTNSTIILSSRGCPFKCPFCGSMFISGKLRMRHPSSVFNEVKEVIEKFDIRQFRFSDDMFTASENRAKLIASLLSKLGIVWRISTRVKPWNRELAKVLYDGGCKEVSFGIESFDDAVLKAIGKKTTAKENENAIRIAKEVGMTVRVLFMIKTPGQRKETVDINIEYLEKLKNFYDIIACTTFVPIPGCLMWVSPQNYGIDILDTDFEHYNFYAFGSKGENPIPNVIRLHGRDEDEVNEETQRFRDYLKNTGKVNKG